MRYLEQYEDSYKGHTAIIIGGGPDAPRELRQIKKEVRDNAVLFGVNRHANLIPDLRFIFFHDRYDDSEYFAFDGVQPITHHKDICRNHNGIQNGICPNFGFSGAKALWCADYMGFDKIYLVGFDCYQGNRQWWHDVKGTIRLKIDPEQAKKGWFTVRNRLKHPERVHVFGGLLVDVFDGSLNEFNLESKAYTTKIEIIRGCLVKGEEAEPGQIIETDIDTAVELINYRKAIQYAKPSTPAN